MYNISVKNESWKISCVNWEISKNNIDAIYYRKPKFPDLSTFNPYYITMLQKDIIDLIDGIVNSFQGMVLSKPYILRKVENKIYQYVTLSKEGIKFPSTYLGNSEDHYDITVKPKIIKPLSMGKIDLKNSYEMFHTSIFVDDNKLDFSLSPVYIQEYVEKKYEVRITVVNDEIWPVKIISRNKVDWRIKDNQIEYSIIEIPNKILLECKKILHIFGLKFGAFDYIVSPEEEWFFLEVNPNGQWLWLEKELKLNISEKIIECLRGI